MKNKKYRVAINFSTFGGIAEVMATSKKEAEKKVIDSLHAAPLVLHASIGPEELNWYIPCKLVKKVEYTAIAIDQTPLK